VVITRGIGEFVGRGRSCDVEMSLVSELVMSCEKKRSRAACDAKVREIERRRSECRFISGDPSERATVGAAKGSLRI